MENLRSVLVVADENSQAVKMIKELESVPWAIKYIGRRLNSVCMEKFGITEGAGFKLELPWEGQQKYVQHNAYDDSRFEHQLVAEVYAEGPAKGRIKSVRAHHWEHWHTSSNWQDHSESYTHDCRSPNDEEIKCYEKLLDGWTEGGSKEQIDGLLSVLKHIASESNGRIIITYNENSLLIHLPNITTTNNRPVIEVNLRQLERALDMSHIHVEAMFLPEFRKSKGIETENNWQLQYILNLFNIHSHPEMYPILADSELSWLYGLYESSCNYRAFMKYDSTVWWRDAWWRLQELMSDQNRLNENSRLLQLGLNINIKKAIPIDDPLSRYVGNIKVATTRPIPDFEPDEGVALTFYDKGERKRYEFRHEVINGINWAYCCHECNCVAIDLSMSESVGDLPNGVAVIPSSINGKQVDEIRALDESIPKSWREVVIDAECKIVDIGTNVYEDDEDYEDSELEPVLTEDWGHIKIGDGAFKDWPHLEKIVFKKNVWEVGSYAFANCRELKNVVFNEGIHSIGTRCFVHCEKLEKLEVKCLSSISAEAFVGCISLHTVDITAIAGISGFYVGESAFEGCVALTHVRITDRISDTEQPIDYLQKQKDLKINIRPCRLEKRCFYGCKALELVEIPYMVKIIADEVFVGCADNCVIHHEGNDVWFQGRNALGDAKLFFWGDRVKYHDEKEMMLSTLMKKLGVDRPQYMDVLRKYYISSPNEVLDIVTGKRTGTLRRTRNYDSDWYDDGLSGGIWYDGYYCADATTFEEAEAEYWNTH